jgi:hypothetical protein
MHERHAFNAEHGIEGRTKLQKYRSSRKITAQPSSMGWLQG